MHRVLETAEQIFEAFGVEDLAEPGGELDPAFPRDGEGEAKARGETAPTPPPSKPVDERPEPELEGFRFLSERPERVVTLAYPFAVRGVEVRSYTLRRLNAEQAAEVGDELRRTGDMATLFSALTGLPFLAVKKMDADDAEALAAAALDFMPAATRAVLTGGR